MQERDHLSVEGLQAGYGAGLVLKGIDLAVPKGQFVALLGSSGCGKTTLLRSIAGFETPRAGRILRDGAEITALPPDQRGMSMVFQSYALWPHKTVAQHIGYGLALRGLPRAEIAARVAEVLAMLGLAGLEGRKPAALSGGQRQRVALGRALAVRPDILLLDEPLSNLDARIRLQLRGEIRALQQALGITAIHVTHDREEAMVMADRIVILDQGVIRQDGSPEEIYNRPNSGFVAAFMGAENLLALEAVAGGGEVRLPASDWNRALPLPGLRPGPVEARFRAEAAVLQPVDAPEAAPGVLSLYGRVSGCSYPGGCWRLSLRIGQASVEALAPMPHVPGSAVRLDVPPAQLFLFAAPADGRGDIHGQRTVPEPQPQRSFR
ncbi:ABC transporter ATP-binding protein [Cereibacter changlensis]|uniref:ABC transporter ATP-binding protein n=1 Tax=Cereibacter changlensis TaxID=402884 RepID=UPI004033AC67